jgi:hypothetical protein
VPAPSPELAAGADDGLGLLPAQHRAGDLRRVGEVREAALVHADAGHRQPIRERLLQLEAHQVVVAAQRDLLVLDVVVGIARADGAHRRLDLRGDEGLVVVHIEQRLRGVGDPPHHLGGDLYRVAAQVVHLDLLRDQVVRAHRDLGLAHPGPHPAQALGAAGATVGAEQRDHGRLVRLQHVEATPDQHEADQAADQREHACAAAGMRIERGEDVERTTQQCECDEQHHIAAEGERGLLRARVQAALAGPVAHPEFLRW